MWEKYLIIQTVHLLPVLYEVNLDWRLTQRQNIQLKFSSYLWCTRVYVYCKVYTNSCYFSFRWWSDTWKIF
jgi:hypothetical protein